MELDLRKLENDLLAAHVKMLQCFLPQNFSVRGGDADGVAIELLLRRMSNKSRIIQTHAIEKFQPGFACFRHDSIHVSCAGFKTFGMI